MKIALVDDVQESLAEIDRLCKRFGESRGCLVETVSFQSGEAFLAAFDDGGFDFVFMDVYMEGMDGVAAAFQMRRLDNGCLLVFLTSSTEFMPEAFSCHAFEYVTKPFSQERIFAILSDAVKMLPQHQNYMELAVDRRNVRIFHDDIAFAVTDAHYLDITLVGGERFRSRMTMPEFLGKAEGDGRFILINKGIVVNAERILAFEKGACIMESGARFPVRVRDSAKVEQMVRDYHFEKIRRRQADFAGRLAKPHADGYSGRKN